MERMTTPTGMGEMGVSPQYMGTQRVEVRHRGPRASFLFSAFAFGAVVGGTLGLLFAPRKGSEIREVLVENVGGRGVSGEFRERVNKALTTGRTTTSDLIGQTQHDLEELRNRALNRIDDAKLRAQIIQKQAELRYLQGRERMRQM